MTGTMEKDHLLTLTSDIVASHVANNRVETASLPELIREIYTTLSGIAVTAEASSAPRPEPAVPVKKSITADYLICLEDGKKLKMLKRHLQSSYKMTPEQYRARWDLPADYPMVAPNYATQRRELAKKIGLGTARRRPRR
jgi:predicted transcriptional regulator